MATTCPSCGAQLASQKPHCSNCGAPLTGTPPAGTLTPTVALGVHEGTTRLGAGQASLHVEDGAKRAVYPLGSAPLTIGRAATAELHIHSPIVSAAHARVEPEGQGHRIVDLSSTNGLLYQGYRLTPDKPQLLRDGDVIRIGDPATGSFVTLTYKNPLVAPVPSVPPVTLLGPGQTLTIGRGHGGGIWKSPQVSRDHAAVETLPDGGHVLRDLGSTNGTFVNGQRIQQQQLNSGDLIQIGPFKLFYDGTRLLQQDQRSAMRLEARGLTVVRPDPMAGPLQRVIAGTLALLRIRPYPQRVILDDVSLCIEPGEFVALVGGSGAGKSTLMGALSGFARATTGFVSVNGDNFYANFDAYRPVLGYVPQDDIVHRPLPVTRALTYAGRLRLPVDMSGADIRRRVAEVLDDVEMAAHRAKQVEDLSGGQRKRVSIASELLADPALFFLDEPTSGLDPGLEKKMMYTLRRLADRGRTIVLVTHATANIDQCSLVAFLAAGRLVYYGPPADAGTFFGVNSGDFADIYTRLEGRFDPSAPAHAQNSILAQRRDEWKQNNPGARAEPSLAELWASHFQQSAQYRQHVEGRLSAQRPPVIPQAQQAQTGRHGSVGVRQFLLLTWRYLDLTVQDTKNLAILLAQAPVIAALLAFVARPEALSGEEATFASARPVLFMLATVAVWFGIINAAREITKEAAIYRRERLAGLKVAPYLCSKVVVLALLVLFQSAVLLAIVGAKVALPADGLIFAIGADMFITTFLAALAGLALGLLISTVASTPDRAISIVPLALIPQIVLSGVIFKLEGSAEVLSWLAIGRWAMDAYGAIIDLNSLPQLAGGPPVSPAYDEYTHEPGHLALRWLFMVIYTAVSLGLTAWLLRRKDQPT